MALTFSGISKIHSIGGGLLKIFWSVATGGTVESYNIYVRNGNSSIFSSTYLLSKVENTLTAIILITEADGTTLFSNNTTYHIGVKAKETGGSEDSNIVVKTGIPSGDQSNFTEAPDRKTSMV